MRHANYTTQCVTVRTMHATYLSWVRNVPAAAVASGTAEAPLSPLMVPFLRDVKPSDEVLTNLPRNFAIRPHCLEA